MKNQKETVETIIGTVLYGILLFSISSYLINYFEL